LTAVDLATGKAIALTPWSDKPSTRRLLSTQRTDAKGAFDYELPTLDEGQIVKLVATKGTQTFTGLFNSRGQTLGADTPTTATYQLQQGQAVSITVRVRLTAGTTAVAQAFEGILKLTFQLPANLSAQRRAAILEMARKAAQQVEEALAKQPEVAARLVATVNSAGETNQVENFRTAVTNMGMFDPLFNATQAELLAIAAETLVSRPDLAPIMARDFPLDRVVISPSGLLGFSGQQGPIKLGGEVNSNFVPASSGGSGSAPAPALNPDEVFGLGLVALADEEGAKLAVAMGNRGIKFYNESELPLVLAGGLSAPIYSAAKSGVNISFFGGRGQVHWGKLSTASNYRLLAPGPTQINIEASPSISLGPENGEFHALAGDGSTVYAAPNVASANIYAIQAGGATATWGGGASVNNPTAMAAWKDNTGTTVIFVGTADGSLMRYVNGTPADDLTQTGKFSGRIYGTALCSVAHSHPPHIYVSVDAAGSASDDIYFYSFVNGYAAAPTSSGSIFDTYASKPIDFQNPRGLAIAEGHGTLLYYGRNDVDNPVASLTLTIPHT